LTALALVSDGTLKSGNSLGHAEACELEIAPPGVIGPIRLHQLVESALEAPQFNQGWPNAIDREPGFADWGRLRDCGRLLRQAKPFADLRLLKEPAAAYLYDFGQLIAGPILRAFHG
jgi:hypothetical protein